MNRNQFGATLGGPILKDGTFFFLSYEGFRQAAPQVSTTRVPTPAERASVTDPISRRLLAFWPEPNATGTLNYVANVSARASDDTGLLRVDHSFGRGDRLTGRWIEFRGSTFTPGQIPRTGGQSQRPVNRSLVLSETHIFTPTFLNEIRLGFFRFANSTTAQDRGFNAATIFTDAAGRPLPGVVDAAQDPVHSGLPSITVAGGFARIGSQFLAPSGSIRNTYELFENMSWINPLGRSRHSWRWGFHIRREESRAFADGPTRGTFILTSFAGFAAGLVDSATFQSGTNLSYMRRYPWDLFWQDQYKVRENFTLNYGLRYDYFSVPVERRGHWTNFIPGIGPMIAGTDRILDIDPSKTGPASIFFRQAPFVLSSSAGVKPGKRNFAPVVGFAYSPRFAQRVFGRDKTVIRGGFRVGYDDSYGLLFNPMSRNAPYNLQTRQAAGMTQPGRFPWGVGFNQDVPLIANFGRQGPGTPTVGVLPFQTLDPGYRNPYLYQFNLGIQRMLGSAFSIEAYYQGSAGHKLDVADNPNQPVVIVRDPARRGPVAPNEQVFPYNHYAGIYQAKSIGNSHYHGMVLTAKYQSHGRGPSQPANNPKPWKALTSAFDDREEEITMIRKVFWFVSVFVGLLSLSVVLGLPAVGLAQPSAFTTFDFPGSMSTDGRGINSRGDIVGDHVGDSGRMHGFLLSDGVFTTLDPPGSILTQPFKINPRGDIVGAYSTTGGPPFHGFLLRDGVYTTLDFPGAFATNALGINPRGDIVGYYRVSSSDPLHGFLLRDGVYTTLDVPGATLTRAFGINPRGDIVGYYNDSGCVDPFGCPEATHGFLLSGGVYTTLDFPDAPVTAASGINPRGDIVGNYGILNVHDAHGWLLSGDVYTPVHPPAAILTEARDINARGDIVGGYTDTSGHRHGYVLRCGGGNGDDGDDNGGRCGDGDHHDDHGDRR